MPIIDLIRHGQSELNARMDENPGIDPLIFDAPLTELGKRQAAELGERLKSRHYDLIITSPLTRALQTTMGIFGKRDIPTVIEHSHCEILFSSGDVGRAPHLLAAEFPHWKFDHLEPVWWHDTGERGPHGFVIEPEPVFTARVKSFADQIRQREENSIAVIGHGGFFYKLIGRWLENCEVQTFDPHGFEEPHRFMRP